VSLVGELPFTYTAQPARQATHQPIRHIPLSILSSCPVYFQIPLSHLVTQQALVLQATGRL
jgi:hypothetical protein